MLATEAESGRASVISVGRPVSQKEKMSFGFSIIFWKEKCFGKNVVYPFLLQKL
jgi:hypothetical protein